MRRSDIKAEVRVFLPYDNNNVIWTDEELNTWINLGIDDMCARGRVYQKTDTTLQVSLTGITYPAPTDTIFITDILYNYADKGETARWQSLDKIRGEQLGQVLTNDVYKPLAFKLIGSDIYILPAIEQQPDNVNLTVIYYAKADHLTDDNDSPAFPQIWHLGLVYYVLWRAFDKAERFQQAKENYEKYIRFLTDVRTEYSKEGSPPSNPNIT